MAASTTDSLPLRGMIQSAVMTVIGVVLVVWPVAFAGAVLRSADEVDPQTLRPSWPAGEFTTLVMGVLAPISFMAGCILLFVGVGSVVVGLSPRLQQSLLRWNERETAHEAGDGVPFAGCTMPPTQPRRR